MKPTAVLLTISLGPNRQHGDELLEHIGNEHGSVLEEWKVYGMNSGWSMKPIRGKRNLLFFTACDGSLCDFNRFWRQGRVSCAREQSAKGAHSKVSHCKEVYGRQRHTNRSQVASFAQTYHQVGRHQGRQLVWCLRSGRC